MKSSGGIVPATKTLLRSAAEKSGKLTAMRFAPFLRRRYGITQVDFDRMFFEQDGRCAVCDLADFPGPGNKPHVDHNHKTGKVRALVCVRCNVLLGMAQEQPERFHAALRYLEKHKVDM